MLKKIILTGLGVALAATTVFGEDTTTTVSLTDEQKDTLLFIYQEEKVARDVYIVFGGFYTDQNVYENIARSEQEHMDSAQILCETYGVDISNVDEDAIGVFVVPELQEAYDTLLAQGYQSELSALMVGEYAELKDIVDLEEAEKGMPADVVSTYEDLKADAYKHLAAFRRAMDAYNNR